MQTVDKKMVLSTLWIFVMFNYLYADILVMIVHPTIYQKAAANMSSAVVLTFAALMEIPILMILLSRVLPYRANRWANIIAGAESTVFAAFTLSPKMPSYYLLFSSIEIVSFFFPDILPALKKYKPKLIIRTQAAAYLSQERRHKG